MNRLNTFEEKQHSPKGVVIYKYTRNGSTKTIRNSRYELYRGNRKHLIFNYIENRAKKIDKFLKECVTFQLFVNNR